MIQRQFVSKKINKQTNKNKLKISREQKIERGRTLEIRALKKDKQIHILRKKDQITIILGYHFYERSGIHSRGEKQQTKSESYFLGREMRLHRQREA